MSDGTDDDIPKWAEGTPDVDLGAVEGFNKGKSVEAGASGGVKEEVDVAVKMEEEWVVVGGSQSQL